MIIQQLHLALLARAMSQSCSHEMLLHLSRVTFKLMHAKCMQHNTQNYQVATKTEHIYDYLMNPFQHRQTTIHLETATTALARMGTHHPQL